MFLCRLTFEVSGRTRYPGGCPLDRMVTLTRRTQQVLRLPKTDMNAEPADCVYRYPRADAELALPARQQTDADALTETLGRELDRHGGTRRTWREASCAKKAQTAERTSKTQPLIALARSKCFAPPPLEPSVARRMCRQHWICRNGRDA
jgi:hypothetical protein